MSLSNPPKPYKAVGIYYDRQDDVARVVLYVDRGEKIWNQPEIGLRSDILLNEEALHYLGRWHSRNRLIGAAGFTILGKEAAFYYSGKIRQDALDNIISNCSEYCKKHNIVLGIGDKIPSNLKEMAPSGFDHSMLAEMFMALKQTFNS